MRYERARQHSNAQLVCNSNITHHDDRAQTAEGGVHVHVEVEDVVDGDDSLYDYCDYCLDDEDGLSDQLSSCAP
jgi:hypothetical protein